MDLGANTVLVTGGGTGIGFGLARRFLEAGSEVVVCGRREDKLKEAARGLPGLRTLVCDLGEPGAREELARRVTRDFPRLNVLVNNAGIQRRAAPAQQEAWEQAHLEIAINLEAPIHLCRLLTPHLLSRPSATIVNVTSGLAFVPAAFAPIYSATKAALRSYTQSLRHELAKTSVAVVELAPPAVNTDLGGPGLHDFGVPLAEFVDAAVEGLRRGDLEITYGTSTQASRASEEERRKIFARLNPA